MEWKFNFALDSIEKSLREKLGDIKMNPSEGLEKRIIGATEKDIVYSGLDRSFLQFTTILKKILLISN